MSRRFQVFLWVGIAAALGLPGAASADDAPVHSTEVIDTTSTNMQCGFPVDVHTFVIVRYTEFRDEQGNPQRVIASVSQAKTTLSANGVVLRSAGAGATITEFEPSGGPGSAVTHGLAANFVVPGAGPVWVEAGRIVYVFGEGPTFTAGVRMFDGLALCTALAGGG